MLFVSKRQNRLPGFGLTIGYTLLYLSLIILLPLTALMLKSASTPWSEWMATLTHPRVSSALRLTFGASFLAALINTLFGSIIAWSLVRYRFFGARFFDAIVDLPFAMPTAVSGIALMAIYGPNGPVGSFLRPWGIQTAISFLGVLIALVFIGLPFVVRTMQPAIEELDAEMEQAAASLGANRWQTFLRVTLPSILPAMITGFTLAFARSLGEYGSVVYMSGNLPNKTEIISLVISNKIEESDIAGASAVAMVLLLGTFVSLMMVQGIQWIANKKTGRA
ncbi:Sulfate transport system permease protein CysT [Pirellula sp. SH-Sr6A]|uniref:sulfate ABC transporter permease subunit CysT n=1 Tax=Pirellula sp. SH-Sr6A TaxID=1632865 RepID=UPI00078B7736|nr:sulfate ABC transporter permease subunit CysT [Pirellula sp. SH-Sr6A]AMV33220.1 Sulfate transport system permease protein CysT [Pirellula sp. SH-Sr6A]